MNTVDIYIYNTEMNRPGTKAEFLGGYEKY